MEDPVQVGASVPAPPGTGKSKVERLLDDPKFC